MILLHVIPKQSEDANTVKVTLQNKCLTKNEAFQCMINVLYYIIVKVTKVRVEYYKPYVRINLFILFIHTNVLRHLTKPTPELSSL